MPCQSDSPNSPVGLSGCLIPAGNPGCAAHGRIGACLHLALPRDVGTTLTDRFGALLHTRSSEHASLARWSPAPLPCSLPCSSCRAAAAAVVERGLPARPETRLPASRPR